MVQGRADFEENAVPRRKALRFFECIENLKRDLHGAGAVHRSLAIARRDFLYGRQYVRIKIVSAVHEGIRDRILRGEAVNEPGSREPDHFRTDGFRHALIEYRRREQHPRCRGVNVQGLLELRIGAFHHIAVQFFHPLFVREILGLRVPVPRPHDFVVEHANRIADCNHIFDLAPQKVQVFVNLQLVRNGLLQNALSVIPRGIELLQGVAKPERAETQVLGAAHLSRLIEAHLHGAEAHFDDRRALLYQGLKAFAAGRQCL